MFRLSLALRRRIGFAIYVPPAVMAVGDVLLALGRHDEAIATYREALASAVAIDSARFVVGAHLAIGEVHGVRGQAAEARQAYEAALAFARERTYSAGEKDAEEKLRTMETSALSQ